MNRPRHRRLRRQLLTPIVIATTLAGSAAPLRAAAGLSAVGARQILESSAHPIYTPSVNERLGSALASGDFDGDGVADLVIGLPRDRHLFGPEPVGEVQVRYGVAGAGLPDGIFADYIWQGGASSVDPPESLDQFGCALAVGNFDGDGYDDLAVGVCEEDVGAIPDAGAVEIRYGGPAGLTHDGVRQLFHQDSAGLGESAEPFDRFGWAMAAGDFDGDGHDDLAISALGEDVFFPPGQQAGAGCVQVLYGGAAGLSTADSQYFDGSELGSTAGAQYRFGEALAAGDFDADGRADLAIGSPGRLGHGAVFVVYGDAGGLDYPVHTYVDQNAAVGLDSAESGDAFGAALATGRFGSDAFDDLVVGVPLEDTGPEGAEVADAGCVHLFFGHSEGLVTAGSQYWTSSTSGISGSEDTADRFGTAVAAGDFDGSGYDDLVIGIPGDRLLAAPDYGSALVLLGTSIGPNVGGVHFWSPLSPGMPGDPESGDRVGSALAAGDFDGDGHDELAIGAPDDDTEAIDAGSVLLLRGALFADGFEDPNVLDGWTNDNFAP